MHAEHDFPQSNHLTIWIMQITNLFLTSITCNIQMAGPNFAQVYPLQAQDVYCLDVGHIHF